MSFPSAPIERIKKSIERDISSALDRAGIMHRVFSRIKTDHSIAQKIDQKSYRTSGKKLQDAIGFRFVLYFNDDVDLLVRFMKKQFSVDNTSISTKKVDEFSATNLNFVCNLPRQYVDEFSAALAEFKFVDTTFEVQIRTILSEGWHEVEHDLRYKFKESWEEHEDLSRMLNGIFASLLSSEWAMEKLFSDLSYRNYKNKKWDSMLRNKFRTRFDYSLLSDKIVTILDNDNNLSKQLFRASRSNVIESLYFGKFMLPKKIDNYVYLCNFLELDSQKLRDLTPKFLIDEFAGDEYIKKIKERNKME